MLITIIASRIHHVVCIYECFKGRIFSPSINPQFFALEKSEISHDLNYIITGEKTPKIHVLKYYPKADPKPLVLGQAKNLLFPFLYTKTDFY